MNFINEGKGLARNIIFMLFVTAATFLVSGVFAAVVKIYPMADTYAEGSSSSTNFGSQSVLSAYNSPSDTHYVFVEFSSADIPAYSINSARIYFYCAFNSGSINAILEECGSGWSENTLTYDSMPGAGGTQAVMSMNSGYNCWYSSDITGFVADWSGGANYGLRLSIDLLNGNAIFDSREAASAFRPYIAIDYNPPGTPTASPTNPGPLLSPTVSATCTVTLTPVSPDSYEPDDSYTQASTIVSGVRQTHSIYPVGDFDWVTFTITQLSKVTLQTSGITDGDTEMWLYDGAGVPSTTIAYNDDGGTGHYSLINTVLAPGTYYVKVNEYDNDEEIPYYYIDYSALFVTPTFTGTMSPTSTSSRTITPTWTVSPVYSPTGTSTITPTFAPGSSLPEAVDNYAFTFTTGGNATWFPETSFSFFGGDAAQSGHMTNSQSCYMETSVTGPAVIAFYWDVSSESGYDYLSFSMDGSVQTIISGSPGWAQKSYSVGAGTHALRWTYSKDGSVSAGSDCGWVDKLEVLSGTMTITPTWSVSPTKTISPTFSVSPTITLTRTITLTSTITLTRTITLTLTVSPYVSCTPTSTCTIAPTPNLNLSEAVDNYALSFSTGGNASWFLETAVTYSGGDAAQSGAMTNSQSCYMQTTVNGPGTFSFYWNVSSESGYDYLSFYIDGAYQTYISGSPGWAQRTYVLTAGAHTLRWMYSKDSSVSVGSDCGWVDLVQWTPSGPSPTATCTVTPTPVGTCDLSQAVDNTMLRWDTGGNARWFCENEDYYFGYSAARSGAVGDGQSSYMESQVRGAGDLSFYWKVSSESGYDFLYFMIDGIIYDQISGSTEWNQKTFYIPDGTHTIIWEYSKNASVSYYQDCAWLDKVVYNIYTPTVTPGVNPAPAVSPTATAVPLPAAADGASYVYPQPANNTAHFVYSTDEAGDAEISVYNLAAKLSAKAGGTAVRSGANRLDLDITSFAPGVYYYLIKVRTVSGRDIKLKTGKFIVQK
jgi:hypothetical protein